MSASCRTKDTIGDMIFLPHDGEHGDFKTGLSAKKILEKFGRKVKITQNIPIEDGIKIARMSFRQMVFDKNKSARLIECLKRYKRSINRAPHKNQVHQSTISIRMALIASGTCLWWQMS